MISIKAIINQYFSVDETGTSLFYPHGALFRGVKLSDPLMEKKLKNYVRQYCIALNCNFAFMFLSLVIADNFYLQRIAFLLFTLQLAVVPLYVPYYCKKQGLEKESVEEKNLRLKTLAKEKSNVKLWVGFLLSLCAFVLGAYLLLGGYSFGGILFIGSLCGLVINGIWIKYK